MQIDWKIDKHKQLILDYFPYLDGVLVGIHYDNSIKQLKLEIVRSDLGVRCVFEFDNVQRYALEIWGPDIISSLRISKIHDMGSEACWPNDSYGPWHVLCRNVDKNGLAKSIKDDLSNLPDMYVCTLEGNLGGTIGVMFQQLKLRLIPY